MNRSVVTHQSTAWWRSHLATSRCTAGRVRLRYGGGGGKRVAWATLPQVMAPLPRFQPHQEDIGQPDRHGLPMNPWPQAALVPIPAQFPRGLCIKLRDRMAPVGLPRQLYPRGLRRQVAPAIFPRFGLPLGRTLPHQPAAMLVPVTGHPPTPHGHTLLAQPPLGASPPAHGAPLPAGHRLEQVIRSPHRTGRRLPHTPWEIRPYRDHIPFLPRLQAGQQGWVVPIVGIRDHAAMRYAPGPGVIEERQGDLR